MDIVRHGLSIGIERVDSQFFISLKAIGKLSHEDYKVISPMIDSALEGIKEPIVDVYIDGSEFEGWEMRAAWDDLKLGIKHRKDLNKIAIYGNKNWQEQVSKIGSWFVSGEVKFFEQSLAALTWLKD